MEAKTGRSFGESAAKVRDDERGIIDAVPAAATPWRNVRREGFGRWAMKKVQLEEE
jgi:hypothetical protein